MSAPTPSATLVLVQSFDQWCAAARALLARQVPPQAVHWRSHPDGAARAPPFTVNQAPALRLPRALLAMLARAACCRVPDRWAILYRVVWRWQHGEHTVLSPRDADGATLRAMLATVRAARQQALAAIRFRERRSDAGPPRFVAWCEPAHDVLPQLGAHFAARMAGVSWMIAAPEASVMWDGAALHRTGALLDASQEPEETSAWSAYCRSVFNPARLQAELLEPVSAQARWRRTKS